MALNSLNRKPETEENKGKSIKDQQQKPMIAPPPQNNHDVNANNNNQQEQGNVVPPPMKEKDGASKQGIFYFPQDGYIQFLLSLVIFIICCLCYSGSVGIIGCITGIVCYIWNKRNIEKIMKKKANTDVDFV